MAIFYIFVNFLKVNTSISVKKSAVFGLIFWIHIWSINGIAVQ